MLFFIFIFLTDLNSPKRYREEEIYDSFSQNTQSVSSSENSLLTTFSSQENLSLNDFHITKTPRTIKTLIFLDTETTGTSNKDEIIEIAAIKYFFDTNIRIFTEQETFHKKIKPNKKITKNATKIHKITQEELNECPKFKDIAQEFLNFIENSTIVAYNASFDIRMINLEFERLNFQTPYTNQKIKKLKYEESIDPLQIAKKSIKLKKKERTKTLQTAKKSIKPVKYTLLNVAKYFKIENIDEKNLHNALPDAKLLFQVYEKLTIKKHDLHFFWGYKNTN